MPRKDCSFENFAVNRNKDKTLACVALVTEVKWLSELNGLGEKNGLEVMLSWVFQGIHTRAEPVPSLGTFSGVMDEQREHSSGGAGLEGEKPRMRCRCWQGWSAEE